MNTINSQVGQDYFVLWMLDFVKEGYFIDIGCNHPRALSNTNQMELLGWDGLGIDITCHGNYDQHRVTPLILADATKIDYEKLFLEYEVPKLVDYLSLDIDIPTYEALIKIPFESYKFKVITIEHDCYLWGEMLRNKQREFLASKGYELLCSDVEGEEEGSGVFFEDWWVLRDFFSSDKINFLKCNNVHWKKIIDKIGFIGNIDNEI